MGYACPLLKAGSHQGNGVFYWHEQPNRVSPGDLNMCAHHPPLMTTGPCVQGRFVSL